ncbi:hypothetical protein QFZ40_003947 [Arthrobacter pascens]|uniref:hypothetical protein n=1 Tax=Arthrobacter pascens TaxID=1677 RepID=UPI002784DB93|nr:hypothetical protein [Arthrobacter pascens]
MEAFSVQQAEHGGKSALLTRAESLVGGASGKRPDVAGTLRLNRHCTPPTEPAGLPDAAGLAHAIAVVKAAAAAGPDFLALADYAEAADFAGQVEDLSRSVEYLQVLGAGAVDRTRTQAITAAAATHQRPDQEWHRGGCSVSCGCSVCWAC